MKKNRSADKSQSQRQGQVRSKSGERMGREGQILEFVGSKSGEKMSWESWILIICQDESGSGQVKRELFRKR
jgi:hypothetical protein